MRVVLLFLAVVAAFNVALITWVVIMSLLEGLRARRERRASAFSAAWGIEPRRPRLMVVPASTERRRRSVASSRLVATTVVGVLVFAGTAFANPSAREAVTSAMRTVGRIVSAGAGDGGTEVASSSASSAGAAVSHATSTPTARSPRASGPSAGPTPSAPGGRGGSAVVTSGPVVIPPSSPGPLPTGDPAPSPTPPPVTPSSLSAIATSSTEVTLSWTDVAGETGFRVDRWDDGAWTTIVTVAAEDTSYVDRDLSASTSYAYRVAAVNDAGGSPPTDPVSVTTPDATSPPSTVSADALSPTKVLVGWSPAAGATGYVVQRSSDGGTTWNDVATRGGDATSFRDTHVAGGTTYAYRLLSVANRNLSSPSVPVTVTTPTAGGHRTTEPAPSASHGTD